MALKHRAPRLKTGLNPSTKHSYVRALMTAVTAALVAACGATPQQPAQTVTQTVSVAAPAATAPPAPNSSPTTSTPTSAAASPPCPSFKYLGQNGQCITAPPGIPDPDTVYMQYLADHGLVSESQVDDREYQLMNRTTGVTICQEIDLGAKPADVAETLLGNDATAYEIAFKMRAAATAYCPWAYDSVSATWPLH